MKSQYKNLLSPLRVGSHLLRNRIISAPATLHSASNGEPYPNEEAMAFFEARARAGAALVAVAGVGLLPAHNDGMHACWDLYTPNLTNRLAQLADRVHYYGAKVSMELLGMFPGEYAVSDGALMMNRQPGVEIPVSEMMKFKDAYAEAAAVLRDLGYDGILLHIGHSVPVAQFLSPLTNKRTDQYGGSTENRVRYINEILEAIRAKAGKDFLIEARISGSEFEDGGIDLEEGIRIGERIQQYIDILQVSAGMHYPKWMTTTHPCGFLPPTPNVFLAEAFKQSGRIHVPISTIGGIGNVDDAENILASGKADLVAAARSFISDIDWIKKGLADRGGDVTPCIKCMRCHDSAVYSHHFQCSVNPVAGLAHIEDLAAPPETVKKVAVIGGGPSGMKAALTAAERGHIVTLFEASDKLGGAIQFANFVPFKYPLADYLKYLVRQIERSPVIVRLGTRADAHTIKENGYDAIIVAIGARPLIPSIPGVERALSATKIYGAESTLKGNIVIIGGGQVGCETALHLATLGKNVHILEMQPELAPDASETHRTELLFEMEKQADLRVTLSAVCTHIDANAVTYKKDGVAVTIPADHVILAAGMISNTNEADSFIGLSDKFSQIGDCCKPRTVEQATREGYYAAVNL